MGRKRKGFERRGNSFELGGKKVKLAPHCLKQNVVLGNLNIDSNKK